MIYLLDANVLIDANRDYYPLKRVTEFWEWLVFKGNEGIVKIPIEMYEEIIEGKDDLALWMKSNEVKFALLLNEEVDQSLVSKVIDEGYANNLTEDDIETIGNDPFLIAYALSDKDNRCVVTTEVSKPKSQRANRHVPDVCDGFRIQWCNTFALTKILDFSTKWNLIKERATIYNNN